MVRAAPAVLVPARSGLRISSHAEANRKSHDQRNDHTSHAEPPGKGPAAAPAASRHHGITPQLPQAATDTSPWLRHRPRLLRPRARRRRNRRDPDPLRDGDCRAIGRGQGPTRPDDPGRRRSRVRCKAETATPTRLDRGVSGLNMDSDATTYKPRPIHARRRWFEAALCGDPGPSQYTTERRYVDCRGCLAEIERRLADPTRRGPVAAHVTTRGA